MNYTFKPYVISTSVWQEDHFEIKTTHEESNLLRESLKNINKYQDLAVKAYKSHHKYCPKRSSNDASHWCEFEYCIKNDKVIVIIRNGMVG